MKLFAGKLLKVETGEYNSLVFHTKKYDMGLSQFVDVSESIGIADECLGFLQSYKQKIGQKIVVGVDILKTKKGGIFCLAKTDVLKEEDIF